MGLPELSLDGEGSFIAMEFDTNLTLHLLTSMEIILVYKRVSLASINVVEMGIVR